MSCEICETKYHKGASRHCVITCARCDYKTCASCFLTWFAQKPNNGCMSCRAVFDASYILRTLPKVLHKNYDEILTTFKLAQEDLLMPHTRRKAMRIIQLDEVDTQLYHLSKLVADARVAKIAAGNALSHHRKKPKHMQTSTYAAELAELIRASNLQNENYTQLIRAESEMRHTTRPALEAGDISDVLVLYCANMTAKCVGILNERQYCELCMHTTCADCGMVYTDTHTCNPDTAASITMLKRDSKPCPSCRSPIYKISGCDHMWCAKCHTEFDWRTLVIRRAGIAHNPDRIAHMARAGQIARHPEDMRCDVVGAGYMPMYRMPNHAKLQRAVVRLREVYIREIPENVNKYNKMRESIALSGYVNPTSGRVYPVYTREQYVRDVKKVIKADRISSARSSAVYIMYVGMLSLLGELTDRPTRDEMVALRKLTNRSLKNITKQYGGTGSRYKLTPVEPANNNILPLMYVSYGKYPHRQEITA